MNFRHFAHDDGRALRHEALRGHSHRRVRRQSAGGVRTAAFEPEDEVAQGTFHALDPGGIDRHLLGRQHPQGRGLGGAALLLDTDDLHRFSTVRDGLGHLRHIGPFASQTHQDNGRQVRVLSQSDQGLRDPRQVGRGLATSLLMAEGHRTLYLTGNRARHLVGADDRREHPHIVPRAHAAIRSSISQEIHSFAPFSVMTRFEVLRSLLRRTSTLKRNKPFRFSR